MHVTTRPFDTIAELKHMIAGFQALFNCNPAVAICAIGTHGCATAVDCTDGSELWFPATGCMLQHIGNRRLTVQYGLDDPQSAIFDVQRNLETYPITMQAAFYLP